MTIISCFIEKGICWGHIKKTM